MTDEVKLEDAVKRAMLRLAGDCESDDDYHNPTCEDVDNAVIVEAALPLFDETAIDEDFADTLSHRQLSDGDAVWVLGPSDTGSTATLLHRSDGYGDFWAMYLSGHKVQMVATRGQLRLLALALGIQLTEQP